MKVRNWHKRNTQAAHDIDATFFCSNGGDASPHVQIVLRAEDRGRLLVTMTPRETRKLIAELHHCVCRYDLAELNAQP